MFLVIDGDSVFHETNDPADALEMLKTEPSARLAETLIPFADPRTAIPGELDRAIDAWNAMTARVKKKVPGAQHIASVEKRARYVKPYRKWRDAIGERFYMLEELPVAVEEQPFLWQTITFGWLFGKKRETGEFHSDKVHGRAFGKVGNGGAEVEYLTLARRVGAFERDRAHLYSGEVSYSEAFESALGVSVERWRQIRKQFNGATNV